MYTIVIQLGAILALPVYFWNRILKFLSTFPRGESGNRNVFTHPLGLTIIAFVITAIPSFLLKKQIGQNLENLWVMAWALFIGGIIMWLVDALCRNPRTLRMEEMSLPQAAWIGFAQIASAIFPGTSRSMSTIAAGQLAGLSRSAALEFSFFLSMPTMVVATGYDLLKTLGHGGDETRLAPLVMTGHNWVVLMIGAIVSFMVALGVVAWFMKWLRPTLFCPICKAACCVRTSGTSLMECRHSWASSTSYRPRNCQSPVCDSAYGRAGAAARGDSSSAHVSSG